MDTKLKVEVLNKIKEIYPEISKKDMIVLFGSRATGFFVKDSDIDVIIFTDNYDYFKRISVKKGLRKEDEDAGFELRLDNSLLLEVKFKHPKLPKFDISFCYDILNAKPLTSKNNFKLIQNKSRKEFMKHYNDLLFHSYIHFFDEYKTLEGLSKRKDKMSRINLYMKKGIVIQALLRLILIMDKKPFPFDKYLAHEVSKTKHWNVVSKLMREIMKMDSYKDYRLFNRHSKEYINSRMPKKPYVGSWWKFLKQRKGF